MTKHINECLQLVIQGLERKAGERGDTKSPAYKKWQQEMKMMFGDDTFKKNNNQEAA